jgi:SAM-dependent methyltransferase
VTGSAELPAESSAGYADESGLERETPEAVAQTVLADRAESTATAASGDRPGSQHGTVSHSVSRHYTRIALLSTLLDALSAAGKPLTPIDSDDLTPVDELHAGGRAATVELVELLAPPSGALVLDMGSGLGGPARYLARHRGCRVVGVDLTREHVEVAAELTDRCGLADLVSFKEANVTALPFPDETFDAAVLVHVGMNVVDKAKLAAEAYRVLRPGGRFALYDIMRGAEDRELRYPVPWASSAEISFLEPPAEYRWLLTEAGFTVEESRDLTGLAVEQLTMLLDSAETRPALGPHVVLGESYRAKATNLLDGLRDEALTAVQLLATRPMDAADV